ncbi:UNVERIFIED_CONTAM: hypothetical protein HDU68_000274, partial [Siphonaria sp. JEL0065]
MRFYNHVGMTINIGFEHDHNHETTPNTQSEITLEQQAQEKERLLLSQTTNIDFVSDMLNRG